MCFGALQHRFARLRQQWISERVVCVCAFQNLRPQESRTVFSGSVSIPSITKSRTEPGRSMSASSGLAARKQTELCCFGGWAQVFQGKGCLHLLLSVLDTDFSK